MALDPDILTLLMLAASGLPTPGAKTEFGCYADGVIKGLKTATVTAITAGAGGAPGQGQFVGILNPGPVVMAPLIQAAAIGTLPPVGGTPMPLQITYFLAIAQIATALLTAQITLPPTDNVAAGVGTVTPGGIVVQGSAIEGLIIVAYASAGLTPTPMRLGMAKAIGAATQQFLALGTAIVPIIGGVPTAPPTPGAGSRIGTLS